jgi:hypothetical protein
MAFGLYMMLGTNTASAEPEITSTKIVIGQSAAFIGTPADEVN